VRCSPLPFPLSPLLLFLVFTQLSTFSPHLSAAVFTNNITITEADISYDGQGIVIDGATVAIDGPHAFNSRLLTDGAPCTTPNGVVDASAVNFPPMPDRQQTDDLVRRVRMVNDAVIANANAARRTLCRNSFW
jgi:hypothetical protein